MWQAWMAQREHDPLMVAFILFVATFVANSLVFQAMKADLRRAGIPRDQFPKATSRGDREPEKWLLSKHRAMYPGDVLPALYKVCTGLTFVASAFCSSFFGTPLTLGDTEPGHFLHAVVPCKPAPHLRQ